VPIPARSGPFDDATRAAAQADVRAALAAVIARERVDVVHLHGVDFAETLPPAGPPALVTLHLPIEWYPPDALRPSRSRTHLHCVSAAQRRDAPPDVRLLPDLPNGVDLDAWGGPHAKRRFVLMLGRICPEKGFEDGFDAARRAGVPALLGGMVHPYAAHDAHFRDAIIPRLGPCARFLGPLDGPRRRRLLAAARALLVPSRCAETGSLVAMEALASGTPVIAYPQGALPDVVTDERTGFLVDDAEGMARAIGRLDRLDPAECRNDAERRFDRRAAVARHLALYEDLAKGMIAP
jgi:glycosyltransferase involved in cell wall biosynthesis